MKDIEQRIEELYQTHSTYEIADILNISREDIYKVIKRRGIKSNNQRKTKAERNKAKILELYHKGCSPRLIGANVGIRSKVIIDHLKRWGVID